MTYSGWYTMEPNQIKPNQMKVHILNTCSKTNTQQIYDADSLPPWVFNPIICIYVGYGLDEVLTDIKSSKMCICWNLLPVQDETQSKPCKRNTI